MGAGLAGIAGLAGAAGVAGTAGVVLLLVSLFTFLDAGPSPFVGLLRLIPESFFLVTGSVCSTYKQRSTLESNHYFFTQI